ncbi:MAG: hypothetical protein K0R28_819 [Paenibacillus sp.]|nr:hypothetical protein [Paenibacillus sp.]
MFTKSRARASAVMAGLLLITAIGGNGLLAKDLAAVGLQGKKGTSTMQTTQGIHYYVSTTGSDTTGTGSIQAPFRTPHKARDVIRQQIAGGMSEDITVNLREGTYYLDSPLLLNET